MQEFVDYNIRYSNDECTFRAKKDMAYKDIVPLACNLLGVDYSPSFGLCSLGRNPMFMRPFWKPKETECNFRLMKTENEGFMSNLEARRFAIYRENRESEPIYIWVGVRCRLSEVMRQYALVWYRRFGERIYIGDWDVKTDKLGTIQDLREFRCADIEDNEIFIYRQLGTMQDDNITIKN